MRNCITVDEFSHKGDTYYDLVSKIGNHYYFKKDSNDNFTVVKKDVYDKTYKESITIEKRNTKDFKRTLASIILGSFILSSVAGCKSNTDSNTPNTQQIEMDEGFKPITDASQVEKNGRINIKDVDKYGIKVVHEEYGKIDNKDVYYIEQLPMNYIPKNSVLRPMLESRNFDNSFKVVDSISDQKETITEKDVQEAIDVIKKQKVDSFYKDILIDAIKDYYAYGCDYITRNMYTNLMRDFKLECQDRATAAYVALDNKIVLGSDLKIDDSVVTTIADYMNLNEEQVLSLINYGRYILYHEKGHLGTMVHNSQTGEYVGPERIAFLVDSETGNIDEMTIVGRSITEGLADYLQYDQTGYKATQLVGYPINDCFFIAMKNMLGIDSKDELARLNIEKVISRLGSLGMVYISDYINFFDIIVSNDISMMQTSLVHAEQQDFSQIFLFLLCDYIDARVAQKDSINDIQATINSIFKEINERVSLTYETELNELVVYGNAGYHQINYSIVQDQVYDYIENIKVKNR